MTVGRGKERKEEVRQYNWCWYRIGEEKGWLVWRLAGLTAARKTLIFFSLSERFPYRQREDPTTNNKRFFPLGDSTNSSLAWLQQPTCIYLFIFNYTRTQMRYCTDGAALWGDRGLNSDTKFSMHTEIRRVSSSEQVKYAITHCHFNRLHLH